MAKPKAPLSPEVQAELSLTERVGRELVRLGLRQHAAHARTYYAAIRDGRRPKEWAHDLNVEWMRVLRIPPYDNDYAVRPRMAGCPKCAASRTYTAMVFPGGVKVKCACGEQWLELHTT